MMHHRFTIVDPRHAAKALTWKIWIAIRQSDNAAARECVRQLRELPECENRTTALSQYGLLLPE